MFAPPRTVAERRADGSILLRSPVPLRTPARAIGEYLAHWAQAAPDRLFLAERGTDTHWRGLSYREARQSVRRVATGLLGRGLVADRPIAILSDNDLNHAILALAAMEVGIPVAPVSSAYSLGSRDFVKLRSVIAQLRPGLVFAADRSRFGPALAAIADLHDGLVVSTSGEGLSFAELGADLDDEAVDARFREIGPDTIAKLLFTSGSTGEPKGVINTQRMLCANQEARVQVWPFLAERPPVIVDWLPWSHTFGANHNFNLVLRNGGTLYLDAGRPVPGLFDQTVANLREVAPTIYFNVPRGYDMLVAALRDDEALRTNFFSRLELLFSAAAALPPHLWDGLRSLAVETLGRPVPITSAWGATETAPMATDCHFQADRTGVIGLPVPGTELKLVPNGNKMEVRVRGPNVTPGYWRRPDLTQAHFDEEGFYRIGDAVRFVDPEAPERGLLFDGRVAEDFKLDTGTWVNVGVLRIKAIAALAPVAQDVVLTGQDRAEIGLLVFPNLAGCRRVAGLAADAPLGEVLGSPAVRAAVARGLAALREPGAGSSTCPTRALLLEEPPSIDRGEITDKAYLNQRAVLTERASLVELLYRTPPDPRVIRGA